MHLDYVKQLVEQHGDALAFVVNVSGGKDSTRMLGFIHAHFPDQKTYVVMADTGFEHVKPVSAEDFARRIAVRTVSILPWSRTRTKPTWRWLNAVACFRLPPHGNARAT